MLFAEPRASEIDLAIAEHRLVAPALMPFEMANIAWKKARKHPESRALILSQWAAFADFDLEVEPINFDETVAFAIRFDVTAYDASYLWLAMAHQASLITLDARLAAAYQQALVEL